MGFFKHLATVIGVLWQIATFIFGVGEEFKNLRHMLLRLPAGGVNDTHSTLVINEPAWAVFTSTTQSHLVICVMIAGILLSCTIVAVSGNLIKASMLIQTLAFFMASSAISTLIGGFVFFCSFGLIGQGGLETWGCAVRWLDAYNASCWRRFWVERAYAFVKEQTILSLAFLIPLAVKGLLQITSKSHGATCLDQGCRLAIFIVGAVWSGFNLIRICLIWITFCAWFRNVPTRTAISAATTTHDNNRNVGNPLPPPGGPPPRNLPPGGPPRNTRPRSGSPPGNLPPGGLSGNPELGGPPRSRSTRPPDGPPRSTRPHSSTPSNLPPGGPPQSRSTRPCSSRPPGNLPPGGLSGNPELGGPARSRSNRPPGGPPRSRSTRPPDSPPRSTRPPGSPPRSTRNRSSPPSSNPRLGGPAQSRSNLPPGGPPRSRSTRPPDGLPRSTRPRSTRPRSGPPPESLWLG